ncbi:MAG: hypothetical protein RR413_06510 [Christensenellaceae bacterium]
MKKSLERYTAFWAGEALDRCCASIITPSKNSAEIVTLPYLDYTDKWMNLQRRVQEFQSNYMRFWYGADAFPIFKNNFGPSGVSVYFDGVDTTFDKDSAWYSPCIQNWNQWQPKINMHTPIAEAIHQLRCLAVEKLDTNCFIDTPDIAGIMDSLAHMRSTENLLFDIADEEPAVENTLNTLSNLFLCLLQENYQIVKAHNNGWTAIGWLQLLGYGITAHLQSDISVMISPADFMTYEYPSLKVISENVDQSVYHLDGIEQIRHLDALFSLPGLNAIEWRPVAGQPPVTDMIDVLKHIQSHGKSIVLETKPDQVEKVLSALSCKGLFLFVTEAKSQCEGVELLHIIEKCSKK